MTNCSKSARPFHGRPFVGQLKFVLAKVQSQFSRLPTDQQNPLLRLCILNYELLPYRLSAHDWHEFVNFVRKCPVDSKVLSKLRRKSKWSEKHGNPLYIHVHSIEEIKQAVKYHVPFRLLRTTCTVEHKGAGFGIINDVTRRNLQLSNRLNMIHAQGELIELLNSKGVIVPLR